MGGWLCLKGGGRWGEKVVLTNRIVILEFGKCV